MSKNRLKTNYIYMMLHRVVLYVMPLAVTPYLSRTLGAEGIGIYSYAYSIVYYFSMCGMFGLSVYGNRAIAMVSHDREEMSKVFWSIYCVQLFTSGIAMVAYLVYSMFIAGDTAIAVLFLPYVVSAAIDIQWLFFGMERFDLTVTRNILVRIFTFVLVLFAVKEPEDIYKYVIIMSVSVFISHFPLWIMLKRYVIWKTPSFSCVCMHLKKCFVLFVPILAEGCYKMTGKTMLGKMSGSSQAGYYENSKQLHEVPTAIIEGFGGVMLPRISNMVAIGQQEKRKQYLEYSIYITSFFSAALCFGVMSVAPEFVPIFFGEGFEQCIDVLWYLMPSSLFFALANIWKTQILIPYKKDKIYVWSVCIGAAINFVLNFVMIPKYDAVGVSLSLLLAEIVVFGIQYYAVREFVNVSTMLYTIPFYCFGIGMLLIISRLSDINFSGVTIVLLKVLIGCSIYLMLSLCYYVCILKKRLEKNKVRED